MSRVLGVVLAACVVSGCPVAVNPDLSLPYRCDPRSPAADQCAGGWRCAADGICRDPTLGAATACQTSADCLGGWHCGVSGTCYDRSTAGAIPCSPGADAGSDCADGWRCPSGGICQQVGVFAPYACQTTADCEGGGHCGLLARCYQRDQAQDVPCRQELDGDPDARDCAPTWVCSANGRCVDAQVYDLQPNGPVSSIQVHAISAAAATAPDHLSVECYRSSGLACTSTVALTVARGATLELRRLPSSGQLPPPTTLTLTDPIDALATTTLPGAALQAYSLVRAGGVVVHISWPPTGAPVATPITVPFLPERILAPAGTPWFVGVSGPDLFLVQTNTAAVIGSTQLPGGLDYGQVSAISLSSDMWMVALSDAGVFAARSTGGQFNLIDGGTQALPEWTPVRIPGTSHAACAGDDGGTGTILGLSQTGSGSTGSGTFRLVQVALVPDQGNLAGRPATYPLTIRLDATPAPCDSAASGATPAPCPLCPPGTSLIGMHALSTFLCGAALPDGGAMVGQAAVSSCAEPTFTRTWSGAAAPDVFDPAEHLVWAFGAPSGQVIVRAPNDIPLLLDQPPAHLALSADGGVIARRGGFLYTPGDAGFELSAIPGVPYCGAVKNAEQYELLSNFNSVALNGPVGVLLADSDRVPTTCGVESPMLGERVELRDGGSAILVAARDRVWAEDLPLVPGLQPPVRISPAPFATISSLAALRPSAVSDPWASAFVVANEQVFALHADSKTRWSASALAGPSGVPFRVWADPQLGRVTYLDGTTYSLPLYARVSGPLPEPAPVVRDLQEGCGVAYALGQTALFRLDQSGAWQAVPGTSAAGTWAALYGVGDTVYAFTADGRAITIVDPSCPRP